MGEPCLICGKPACSDWLFDEHIQNLEPGAVVILEDDIVEVAPDGTSRVVWKGGDALTADQAAHYGIGEPTLAERLADEHERYRDAQGS